MLPHSLLGASKLIEREALLTFLERVHKADDVPALLVQLRSESTQPSRRKIRSLVRRDLEPAALSSLPASITLQPGSLHLSFQTVEALAESMLLLARILENEGDAFAQLYEPSSDPPASPDSENLNSLYEELESLETASKSHN